MGYATISESSLQIAYWLCFISLILSIAILLEVTWLRFNKARETEHLKQFNETWRPVLIKRALGESVDLPKLESRDIDRFLNLWIHYQESLLGLPRTYLNDIVHTLGLSDSLKTRMRTGTLAERIIAITSLGYLKAEEVWQEIEALINHAVVPLSISAARALVNIDSDKAVAVVLPAIGNRRDWPAQKVASILKEASPSFLEAFLAFTEKAMRENKPYLIRLLRLLNVQGLNQSPPYIREILRESKDDELVLAALKLVREPRDVDLVRQRLQDASWQVKVQATKALGRLGDKDDHDSLSEMLFSKDWWLRYRAASALNKMPSVNSNQIDQKLTDPYAKEMWNFATATKRTTT